MLAEEYNDRVWERISQGNPQRDIKIYRPAIQASMNDALGKFAQLSIAHDWRSLLEFDYSLTITSGHAAFGSNTDLVPDSIVAIDNITHSSVTYKFKPVNRRSDLDFVTAIPGMPFAFYFVTLSGIDIAYTSPLTGTLTARAVKTPTIGNVPTLKMVEAFLIDIGALLTIQKIPDAAAGQS